MLWKPELNSLVNWNVEAGRLGKNWGNTFMMTMVGSTRYVAQDFPGGQQMNDKKLWNDIPVLPVWSASCNTIGPNMPQLTGSFWGACWMRARH